MTKIQMIIAKGGDVLNFDHVKSVYLRCDNPKDNAISWTYSIIAKTGDNEKYCLCGGYDYETARGILIFEMTHARQTDGIARFDGDIMARLHERGGKA